MIVLVPETAEARAARFERHVRNLVTNQMGLSLAEAQAMTDDELLRHPNLGRATLKAIRAL